MKNNDFKDLLTSINQARKIHVGKLKAGRVFKFSPIFVKKIQRKLCTGNAIKKIKGR